MASVDDHAAKVHALEVRQLENDPEPAIAEETKERSVAKVPSAAPTSGVSLRHGAPEVQRDPDYVDGPAVRGR